MKEPPSPGLVAVTHGACSVAGLAGFEDAELSGPPGRECLRCADSGTSFSHEVRRVGLAGGAVIVCVSGAWSPSSSDEASASESGVDRRIPGCVLSSLAEAVDGSAGGVVDCDIAVGLLGGVAMTVK